jgi:voltage-gated potassium channel
MTKYKLKNKIYRLLNLELGIYSKIFDYSILLLIFLNCLSIIFESVKEYNIKYRLIFDLIEIVSVWIFSVELILRVWTITENSKYKKAVSGRLLYIVSFETVIDILAIMPFYLSFLSIDLRFIRIFRLLRIIRLFKVARYIKALDIISDVFKKRKEHLFITILLLLFMLVLSSTLMYYIENNAQPDKFSSIPETMWWGVATLTTIGYGDMYPITIIGKILGSIISIIGIGLFALPTGILASGFSEELANREKNARMICPHCNKSIG